MNHFPAIILITLLSLPSFAQHDSHAGHAMPKQDKTSPGVASLDVYTAPDGHLHLLLARREPGRPAALEYLRSTDGGQTWSTPIPVGVGQAAPSPVHRGQDAQIAAAGDRLVAAWTTAGTIDKFGRGPIATAYSHDGGRTWKPGPNPSDDGQASGHAFIDLAADATGTFHIVWLDGRDREKAATAAGAAPDSANLPAAKGLRYARSTDGGATWQPNATLDPATCECCWNTIALGPDNRISVLYRDRDPRDMSVVHSTDGGRTWGKPVPTAPFGWKIEGCPHVGGGLAFAPDDKSTAHAVVWTAKGTGAQGAYVLSTTDGGATWSTPRQLGNDPRSWHTDIATAPRGQVATVWDSYTEDGGAVFASLSTDNGQTWSPPKRLTPPDTSATHPRVTWTHGHFQALWTQSPSEGGPSTWKSAPLPK